MGLVKPRTGGDVSRRVTSFVIAEARWALQFHDRLTAWERKFLADIGRYHRISAKQAAALDGIVRRLREGRG